MANQKRADKDGGALNVERMPDAGALLRLARRRRHEMTQDEVAQRGGYKSRHTVMRWGLLLASLVFGMLGSVHYSGALGIARLIGEGDSWTILRHAGWAALLFTVILLLYKSVSDGTETGFAGWLNEGSVYRCALRGAALGTLLGIQTAGSSRMEEDRAMQLREESAMHMRRLKAPG